MLDDWRVYTFVLHIWRRKLLRELLQYPMGGDGFARLATWSQCMSAVYHCHSHQLFSNVNVAKSLHQDFAKAMRPPIAALPPQVRALVDYVKERLSPGAVVSFPRAFAEACLADNQREQLQDASDAGGAALALLDAGSQEDTWVQEALRLADAGETEAQRVRMGLACRGHVFFMVLRSDLSSRTRVGPISAPTSVVVCLR